VPRNLKLSIVGMTSLGFFLAIYLAGCSNQPGDTGAIERSAIGDTLIVRTFLPEVLPLPLYTLEPDLCIGVEEGPEEYVLLNPGAIAVDEDGNIYVSDQQAGEIRIFDQQGRHRLTFGRRGEGPGEFNSWVLGRSSGGIGGQRGNFLDQLWSRFQVQPREGDMITVEDLPELKVFDRTGGYLTSFNLSHIPESRHFPAATAMKIEWYPEKEYLVSVFSRQQLPGTPRSVRLVALEEDLEIIQAMPVVILPENIYRSQEYRRNFVLPFVPTFCHAVTSDGRLVWGSGVDYRLDTWHPERGEWLRIELDLDPEPVSSASLETWKAEFLGRIVSEDREVYRALLNEATYPEYQPTYAALLGDDAGRIWVQRYVPVPGPHGEDMFRYDLITSEGDWLGIVDSPARLYCVSGGAAYWLDFASYPVIHRALLVPESSP